MHDSHIDETKHNTESANDPTPHCHGSSSMKGSDLRHLDMVIEVEHLAGDYIKKTIGLMTSVDVKDHIYFYVLDREDGSTIEISCADIVRTRSLSPLERIAAGI